jgi:hypothetical protein
MKMMLWLAIALPLLTPFITGGCSEPAIATQVEPVTAPELATTPQGPPAPITEIVPAELPRDFPESLRWLTEEEKAKLVEIALDTPIVQERLQKESQYRTDIGWIALYPSSRGEGYSGYWKFEYEIVEIGIPRGEVDMSPEGSSVKIVSEGVPEDAEIYPDVAIFLGEPTKLIISIAIDLESWEVIFQEERPSRF